MSDDKIRRISTVDKLKQRLVAIEADRDKWYRKFVELELGRAECCWENEKEVKRLRDVLERIAKRNQEIAREALNVPKPKESL
jgi:hypothetical protein